MYKSTPGSALFPKIYIILGERRTKQFWKYKFAMDHQSRLYLCRWHIPTLGCTDQFRTEDGRILDSTKAWLKIMIAGVNNSYF